MGAGVTPVKLASLKGRQETTITSSTAATSIIPAGAAGVFNDLYGVLLSNTSASASEVTIQDGSGTDQPILINVPAGDTRGFVWPSSDAQPQTTAATAWTATCGTSVASMKVTALYTKRIGLE